MSWQATAWAERQKTGSSSRKALLLVLANYADKNGYCWPSQEALAAGAEQSVDTVHRNSRRLESDGFVSIEVIKRKGGRWPRLAYRLAMQPADPQNAEWQPACGSADPHPERSPISTQNGHRSAQLCGMNLQENIQSNIQDKPSAAANTGNGALPRKRPSDDNQRIGDVFEQVLSKLGEGNPESGLAIWRALSPDQQASLKQRERLGTLDPAAIAELISTSRIERGEQDHE
jgi:hypothetical protein